MTPELFGAVLSVEEALAWREVQREAGRRIAFTNGCFDVLHAGHVAYLAWARERADRLVVGLNTDASVRLNKGPLRPFVPFEDRARVLAALRSVDVVVGFGERTPEVLLDALRPEIHVKSDQYRVEDLPERIVVERYGGEIVLAPHVDGKSTTDLVAEIRRRLR